MKIDLLYQKQELASRTLYYYGFCLLIHNMIPFFSYDLSIVPKGIHLFHIFGMISLKKKQTTILTLMIKLGWYYSNRDKHCVICTSLYFLQFYLTVNLTFCESSFSFCIYLSIVDLVTCLIEILFDVDSLICNPDILLSTWQGHSN